MPIYNCLRPKKWTAFLALLLLSISLAPPARAVEFPDTGDRGAPHRTTGGGTRGEQCEADSPRSVQSAHALVPSNNVSTFSSEQASLWIQISETFADSAAEIYVKDLDSNEAVYEQQFEIADLVVANLEKDSLLKIELPDVNVLGLPLLKAEHDYHWEFSIICDPNNRSQDYVLQGLFHRVAASETQAETRSTETLRQRLAQYASAGLWQETLQTAVLLREEQPETWNQLLSSVGLGNLTANGRFSRESVSDGNVGVAEDEIKGKIVEIGPSGEAIAP